MLRIGVVSQKGGVGKSTIAHLIAVEFALAGWSVKIADLDIFQKTTTNWVGNRRSNELTPDIQAEPFALISQVQFGTVDLGIYDGKPSSDRETREIARQSTCVVIPTRPTLFDLQPQVMLAHELMKQGTPLARIFFIVNSVNTDAEARDALSYIGHAGFKAAPHYLFSRAGYATAQNSGRALSEAPHLSLRKAAEAVANDVSDFVETFYGQAAQ